MGIINNKQHFLHEHITFMEPIGDIGKNNGIVVYLNLIGIKTGGSWSEDHSTIDWTTIENHHQFTLGQEGNEREIKHYLSQSKIADYETMLTKLAWEDPVIRVKTLDFIDYWEEFDLASGGEGFVMITEDGKYYIEFTDDWKFHLNSNFEIKPGSKKTKISS